MLSEVSPPPAESSSCLAQSASDAAPLGESAAPPPCSALELWALGPDLRLSDHLAEIERMLTPAG